MVSNHMKAILAAAFPALGIGAANAQQIIAPGNSSVAISTGVTGLGTGVATALGVNVGSAGAPVVLNGALGTPSSGVLTNATGLPYTSVTAAPVFVGTRITSAQTISSGSTTKVQLNSERMDVGNYYDSATNFVYTPLVAGTYEVSGTVYVSGTTVTAVTASISKNGTSGGSGTEVVEATNVGLATTPNQSVTLPATYIAMNGSTDTLELDVTATGTGTVAVVHVRSTSQMSIRWIGP